MKQIEEKDRLKKEAKLKKLREEEILELKIRKEREEIEQRMMMEFTNQDMESRNLFESNFDQTHIRFPKKVKLIF